MGTATRPATALASRELEDYCQQVRAVQQRASQLTADLDDTSGVWRPGPGSWSIAECLDHLNVTAEVFLPAIDRAIERGVPVVGEPQGPHRGWIGAWLLRLVEPPIQKRYKAPQRAQPRTQLTLGEAALRFQELQCEIIARLTRAERIDLAKTRMSHPMLTLLRLRLGDMLAILVAHERRHLWQAEQVLKAPGFPRR